MHEGAAVEGTVALGAGQRLLELGMMGVLALHGVSFR